MTKVHVFPVVPQPLHIDEKGNEIFAVKATRESHVRIVLARPKGASEFVTWMLNTTDGGGYFWGHYFCYGNFHNKTESEAYAEALADFNERE